MVLSLDHWLQNFLTKIAMCIYHLQHRVIGLMWPLWQYNGLKRQAVSISYAVHNILNKFVYRTFIVTGVTPCDMKWHQWLSLTTCHSDWSDPMWLSTDNRTFLPHRPCTDWYGITRSVLWVCSLSQHLLVPLTLLGYTINNGTMTILLLPVDIDLWHLKKYNNVIFILIDQLDWPK